MFKTINIYRQQLNSTHWDKAFSSELLSLISLIEVSSDRGVVSCNTTFFLIDKVFLVVTRVVTSGYFFCYAWDLVRIG